MLDPILESLDAWNSCGFNRGCILEVPEQDIKKQTNRKQRCDFIPRDSDSLDLVWDPT